MSFFKNALGLALTLAALLAFVSASRADTARPEYEVKAAIVYKVSKFVSYTLPPYFSSSARVGGP